MSYNHFLSQLQTLASVFLKYHDSSAWPVVEKINTLVAPTHNVFTSRRGETENV